MLRIYSDYLGVLRDLSPVLSAVEARDTDLARQLRRAAASVALNMAEASGNAGGTRRQRYLSAMGSAREVTACLQVADALGYGADRSIAAPPARRGHRRAWCGSRGRAVGRGRAPAPRSGHRRSPKGARVPLVRVLKNLGRLGVEELFVAHVLAERDADVAGAPRQGAAPEALR
jgi:hypothetical protein